MKQNLKMKNLESLKIEIPLLDEDAEGHLRGGFAALQLIGSEGEGFTNYRCNFDCNNGCNESCVNKCNPNEGCNKECNDGCNIQCTNPTDPTEPTDASGKKSGSNSFLAGFSLIM